MCMEFAYGHVQDFQSFMPAGCVDQNHDVELHKALNPGLMYVM